MFLGLDTKALMLRTITPTRSPATDLGHLLHKHPARLQSFSLSLGGADVLRRLFEPLGYTVRSRVTSCRRCFAGLSLVGETGFDCDRPAPSRNRCGSVQMGIG